MHGIIIEYTHIAVATGAFTAFQTNYEWAGYVVVVEEVAIIFDCIPAAHILASHCTVNNWVPLA